MVIRLSEVCFLKQVLAGIGNILLLRNQILGMGFQVQFDGVFRNANFWLNGFYLGNNLSGYIGKSFDITDYINYDHENVLVVRV